MSDFVVHEPAKPNQCSQCLDTLVLARHEFVSRGPPYQVFYQLVLLCPRCLAKCNEATERVARGEG